MSGRAGAAVLLFAAASAYAVDWTVLKQQGYLSDYTGVVDARSREVVDRYAAKVEKATGAQIAIAVISSLQGEPVNDVAAAIYRAWDIGQKNKDSGVLLLLVLQDRECHLQVGQGLQDIMPDRFDGLLLDNMRTEIRAAQLGPAIITAAQAIGELIANQKRVKLAPPPQPRTIQWRHHLPWIPILFGLFLFWFLLRVNSGGGGRTLTGFLLGNLLNRGSYSGRGGGAFGGYDSGGSRGGFNGFGGGDTNPDDRRKTHSDW